MEPKLNIEEHDSTPSIPLTDEQRVACGDLAKALAQAQTEAYVEANVLRQLLELTTAIVSKIPF